VHVLNDIVLNQVRIPVSNWSTAEGDIDRFADVGLPNIEDAAARIARLGGESHTEGYPGACGNGVSAGGVRSAEPPRPVHRTQRGSAR